MRRYRNLPNRILMMLHAISLISFKNLRLATDSLADGLEIGSFLFFRPGGWTPVKMSYEKGGQLLTGQLISQTYSQNSIAWRRNRKSPIRQVSFLLSSWKCSLIDSHMKYILSMYVWFYWTEWWCDKQSSERSGKIPAQSWQLQIATTATANLWRCGWEGCLLHPSSKD